MRRREGDRERWGKEEAGVKEGGREGRKEGGREGRREGRKEGGRKEGGNYVGREGEREKRMDRNTNCFVQLHTTQNFIPRQSGMRVYTQGHCCVTA